MKRTGFLLVTLLFLKVNVGSASVMIFFGEDINRDGGSTVASPVKSSAASGRFLANLANIGTETFEAIPTGTFVPMNVNFSSLGSAVLSGSGTVVSGDDGSGRFPISGSHYLLTAPGDGFNLRFSTPVSGFGFYGTDIGDYGGQIVLTLTDVRGQISTLTVPNTVVSDGSTTGSVLYYAFLDNADAYTNILLSNVQVGNSSIPDSFAFDNLTVGSVSASPEPGAFALMGLGTVGLFGLQRVKRSRANKNQ